VVGCLIHRAKAGVGSHVFLVGGLFDLLGCSGLVAVSCASSGVFTYADVVFSM
jgi:hypothetical protein